MTKKDEKKVEEVVEKLKYFADLKSLEEIEKLGKSRKINDQLEALELFEEKFSELPLGRSRKFIERKRKSKNEKIQTRAEEVYQTTVLKRYEKLSKTLKLLIDSYNLSVASIIPDLSKISESFSISQQIAKQLKDVYKSPIFEISKQMAESQKQMRELIAAQVSVPKIAYPSPIITTSFYTKPLVESKRSKKTLSTTLKKDSEDIQTDLDGVLKSDSDIIFNFKAYPVLFELEILLRGLIQKRIIEPYSSMLGNKIPGEVIIDWETRRDEEKKNPLVDDDYDLIYYSDFNDLKQIFEKGKNYQEFSDIANEEQFRALISKLHELDPIRKKIAHSRPLSQREFDRLIIYASDIRKIFSGES